MSPKEELLAAVKGTGGIYLVESLAARCSPEDLGHALVLACYMGDIAKMAVLVFHDADVRFQHDLPLRMACRSSKANAQVVKALLDLGCDPNTADGNPLYYAASLGYLDVAKALLEAGANHTYPGNPALVPASVKGDLKMVRLLVEAGASPEIGLQALADDAVRRAFNHNRLLPGQGLGVAASQVSTLDYLKGKTLPTLWDHLLSPPT